MVMAMHSENKICLCVLCGLPASGKSTFARKLSRESTGAWILHFEYDQYISDIKTETLHSWKNDRKSLVMIVEAVMQSFYIYGIKYMFHMTKPDGVENSMWTNVTTSLFNHHSSQEDVCKFLIVVDDNMYLRSMRYEYYKLARKLRTSFCQIHVHSPLEIVLRRNMERDFASQVHPEVIHRMAAKIEPPNNQEYKWEKHSLHVNAESNNIIKDSVALIEEAFMHQEKPPEENEEEKEASRAQVSSSMTHQVDLILRKCVAALMAKEKLKRTKEDLKDLGKKVFTVKEQLLSDWKENKINVSSLENTSVANAAQDFDSELNILVSELFISRVNDLPS